MAFRPGGGATAPPLFGGFGAWGQKKGRDRRNDRAPIGALLCFPSEQPRAAYLVLFGVARHLVAAPLVADPVRGVHVGVVQRVAPARDWQQLVYLEAPRVSARQAVVYRLAAYVAWPSLRPQPRSQLAPCVAVAVARVAAHASIAAIPPMHHTMP